MIDSENVVCQDCETEESLISTFINEESINPTILVFSDNQLLMLVMC